MFIRIDRNSRNEKFITEIIISMDRFNSRKDTAEERIRELKAEEMI